MQFADSSEKAIDLGRRHRIAVLVVLIIHDIRLAQCNGIGWVLANLIACHSDLERTAHEPVGVPNGEEGIAFLFQLAQPLFDLLGRVLQFVKPKAPEIEIDAYADYITVMLSRSWLHAPYVLMAVIKPLCQRWDILDGNALSRVAQLLG